MWKYGRKIGGPAALAWATLWQVLPATAATLAEQFQHPDKAVRATVRWWWPGGAVDSVELRREVALLAQTGFGAGEIQAFNPGIPNLDKTERANVTSYATPSFYAHVAAAAAEARAQGIRLDYTFGSGWPTGGGYTVTPEMALLELNMSRIEVEGGKHGVIQLAMPERTVKFGATQIEAAATDPRLADWPARIAARSKVVAVIAVRGSAPLLKEKIDSGITTSVWRDVTQPGALEAGSQLVLTDKLAADGTLNWIAPPGTWQVMVFKQFLADAGTFIHTAAGPSLALDHLSAGAFDAYAAQVVTPLLPVLAEQRGALRSTFIDSLELMPDLYWCEDFLAQFQRRRGYDLTPYLPLVIQPGWIQGWGPHYSPPYFEMGDIGERIRADYRQTISDLMIENFSQPFVAWNRAHGVQSRQQAHGGPWDVLKAYGQADIPETEDLPGGGDPYFMRLARSAANLYGRQIVSAESGAFKERPFDVTPDDLRQRADLIYASGVNHLVLHGFPYASHVEKWPGWYPFGPNVVSGLGFSSMLAESNPIWVAVAPLAEYLARTQAVLQQGQSVVPVAMYMGDFGTGEEAHQAHDVAGMERALLTQGFDHDRINADSLRQARIERGQLVIAKARYQALVLPLIGAIPADVMEAIARFASAGLPVVFAGEPPRTEQGFLDHVRRDARVASAVAATLKAKGRTVAPEQLPAALQTMGVRPNLSFAAPSEELIFVQRSIGSHTVYFIHNRSKQTRDATFATSARGAVERWFAMTGKREAQVVVAGGHQRTVPLSLAGGESALLVFDPQTKQLPVALEARRVTQSLELGAAQWRFNAVGHGRKGRQVEFQRQDFALQDWRDVPELQDFSGNGRYARQVELPPAWLATGGRVVLDLGQVHDAARVTVNGVALPVLIGQPWRVDVSSAVRPGANQIVIEVFNTPNNAMFNPKAGGYKLLKPVPAGLAGPVTLSVLSH